MARDTVVKGNEKIKKAVRSFIELAISGELADASTLSLEDLGKRYVGRDLDEVFTIRCLLEDYLAKGGPIYIYLNNLGIDYKIVVNEKFCGVDWMLENY